MSLRPVFVASLLPLAACAQGDFGARPAAPDEGFVAPDPAPPQDETAAWDPERAAEVLDGTWYGDVLVSNDALVLDDQPCFERFVRAEGSATVGLLFSCDEGPRALREGQVLVSGRDGGLLARVEALSVSGTGATVLASPARLTDVIFVARHAERVPLPLEVGDLPPSPLRDPRTYDFSGLPLFSVSGSSGSASAEVDTGVITLDPSFDFGLDIDWFDWSRPWPKLEKADLGVVLDAQLDLVLHAEAQGSLARQGERDLFEFDKAFSFSVGPVPVAGEVAFDVDLVWSVEAQGSADVRAGTSITSTVGLGGRYEDGDWLNTSRFEWNDALVGPEIDLDGQATARASLRVRAVISMYSAVSADLAAEPWVQADAALACGDIDWSVDLGVELSSSVGYDVLGFSGSWDFPDFSWDKRLAEGVLPVYDAAIDPSCGTEGPSEAPETTDNSGAEAGGDTDRPDGPGELLETLASEQCVDGIDNDADGAIDCADSECADSMACGSECTVWDNISCGDVVRASTLGAFAPMDSKIAGYPVNTGLYSGPEAAFAFRSPLTTTVTFRLVDPEPTAVDHDLMILHTPTGVCSASHAVQWGPNRVELEAVRGEQYLVVVDGFDGDAGDFTLEVVCGG